MKGITMGAGSVQPSKGARAYDELRRRIISGELAPGSRLSQYELADALSMSITPLREAIRQLASENWVVMETHRDARVASMSAGEARELLEARYAIEPIATELAALRRTNREIDNMKAAADSLLPVTREWGEEAIVAHRAFHRAVYTASHNTVMIKMLDDLWDKGDRYRRIGLELPAGAESRTIDLEQHHKILELVTEGEGAQAAELVRNHIRNSLGALVSGTLQDVERTYASFGGH